MRKKLIEVPLKNNPMVCCVCGAVGPSQEDKDWRGWSQSGVVFIPPNMYQHASTCPVCLEMRERLSIFCAKGSWGITELRERFDLGGGIFGAPSRRPAKKVKR